MNYEVKEKKNFLIDGTGEVVEIKRAKNLYQHLVVQGEYIHMDPGRYRMKVEDLHKHFEPVHNFQKVSVDHNKGILEVVPEYWYHKETDFYLDGTVGGKYVSSETDPNYFYIDGCYITYDLERQKKFIDLLNEIGEMNYSSSSYIYVIIKGARGFKLHEAKIKPLNINLETMYNDDFIKVHNHLLETLKDKNKGVALLHGKPGTGKTNYIKWLTTLIPEKKFIFVPSGMISFLDDPGFLSTLIDNQNSIIVLEDCEIYIQDRKNAKYNMVATMLNLSDGILSDVVGIQFICTFNNDIKSVDSALTRKGRLIDEYEFKELEESKAKSLCNDIEVDYEVIESRTLANIFNAKDGSNRTEKEESSFGFIKSAPVSSKGKKIGFGNE